MNEKDKRKAFEGLLSNYLRLSAHDELVTIYDESFRPHLHCLVETVNNLGIQTTLISLPRSQQLSLMRELETDRERSEVELPHGLMAAMSAASGILNVVSGAAETTAVRRAIVHQPRNNNCRLAHIPDVANQLLRLILETPLDVVAKDCELLAYALGNSKEARIETVNSKGRTFVLTLLLNGWDNEPIISSGVIPPGSWGNVPGGETFYCPKLEGINGKICINGSVPTILLAPEDELVLTFSAGRLVHWEGRSDSPAMKFLNSEKTAALRRNDHNWSAFAELGIGVNPAVVQLTGNALFDEKAAGTIHVAIGDNSGFGHDVDSGVHHDMVTKNPTLLLDNRVLVSGGAIQRSNFSEPGDLPKCTTAQRNAKLNLRLSRIEIQGELLMRRLYSGHRVGYMRIASDEISAQLARMYLEIRTYDGTITTDEFLREHPSFGGSSTLDLLSILYHYRMLA